MWSGVRRCWRRSAASWRRFVPECREVERPECRLKEQECSSVEREKCLLGPVGREVSLIK